MNEPMSARAAGDHLRRVMGLPDSATQGRVETAVREALGSLAANCDRLRVQRGKVTVRVKDPAAATAIRRRSATLGAAAATAAATGGPRDGDPAVRGPDWEVEVVLARQLFGSSGGRD
jgi:hypothetical protein